MTPTPVRESAQAPAELPSRWMSRADVLTRFNWTDVELTTATATLGFPAPQLWRELRRPGVHGFPERAGKEALWSRSGVEEWARVFADLARKTSGDADAR